MSNLVKYQFSWIFIKQKINPKTIETYKDAVFIKSGNKN